MKPIKVTNVKLKIGDVEIDLPETTMWQGDFRPGTRDSAEMKAVVAAEMDARLGRVKKA